MCFNAFPSQAQHMHFDVWKNTFIHRTDTIELKTRTTSVQQISTLLLADWKLDSESTGEAVCRLYENICKAGTAICAG